MKKNFRYSLLFLLITTIFLAACGTSAEKTPESPTISENTADSEIKNEPETDQYEEPALPTIFPEEVLELSGSYFKGGNYGSKLTISAYEPELPTHLDVYAEDAASETFQYFSMKFDDTASSWTLSMDNYGNFPKAEYTLERNDNGSVILVCDDKEEITYDTYYSLDTLTMPDAFTRPLNQTDLLTLDKEQTALLRNEFFAAYGRKFTNAAYQDYFLNQDWYVPLVEPQDFSDSVFSRLIKRNVAFLTNAEADFDEASWKQNLADYQALSEAPYLSYLPDGEISIHLDSTQAEDMGIYYKASGRIAVPVTITEEEYRSLDNGTVLQLCINELTGETIKIKRSDETDSGNNNEQAPYLLVPEDGYSHDVNFTYQPETNTYTLWIFSDDTVFCTVYEGDIYVLKGAAEEYFYHFEHYENPLTERSGVYQIMTFDEEPSGFDMDYYYGNQPVFDEKGYLKALYFYGD